MNLVRMDCHVHLTHNLSSLFLRLTRKTLGSSLRCGQEGMEESINQDIVQHILFLHLFVLNVQFHLLLLNALSTYDHHHQKQELAEIFEEEEYVKDTSAKLCLLFLLQNDEKEDKDEKEEILTKEFGDVLMYNKALVRLCVLNGGALHLLRALERRRGSGHLTWLKEHIFTCVDLYSMYTDIQTKRRTSNVSNMNMISSKKTREKMSDLFFLEFVQWCAHRSITQCTSTGPRGRGRQLHTQTTSSVLKSVFGLENENVNENDVSVVSMLCNNICGLLEHALCYGREKEAKMLVLLVHRVQPKCAMVQEWNRLVVASGNAGDETMNVVLFTAEYVGVCRDFLKNI